MGAKYEIQEIPADLVEKADEYRAACCSRPSPRPTTQLLEKYFGGEELTVAEIKAAIRKLTVN